LWLNEGFARFMEHCAVDFIYPEWDIWLQYSETVFSLALSLDANINTHAVEVPIDNADEVNEIFDTISYAKGCSAIAFLGVIVQPFPMV
jgi:aminopeptidase 2